MIFSKFVNAYKEIGQAGFIICSIACLFVSGGFALYKVISTMMHNQQQVIEIVVRQDVTHLSKLALCHHIALAKLLFAHLHLGIFVALPNHFAPMNAAAVDGAAVVEYYAFNHISLKCIFVFFSLPSNICPQPPRRQIGCRSARDGLSCTQALS